MKFTFDSVILGSLISEFRSGGSFRMVRAIEAPDPETVIFRLSEPYAAFLWDMTRPAIGIVPAGSRADFAEHPIGSGPFRFVSAEQDENVVIERNPNYFHAPPQVKRVIFRIVPDAVVRALELRKGSADIDASSALTPDVVSALAKDPSIAVTDDPGTHLAYIAVNFDDPALAHSEVRQALAYAMDRETIVRYLLRGQARIADGALPPNSWAYEPNVEHYPYDPARAEQLLDSAGFPRRSELGGMRLHLVLKTSTEESTRLLAAVLQDQWRRVGIGSRGALTRDGHAACRRFARQLSALYAALGRRQTTTTRTSLNWSSILTACRPTDKTGAITAIRISTRSWTRLASNPTASAAGKSSPRCSASSPKTCPI